MFCTILFFCPRHVLHWLVLFFHVIVIENSHSLFVICGFLLHYSGGIFSICLYIFKLCPTEIFSYCTLLISFYERNMSNWCPLLNNSCYISNKHCCVIFFTSICFYPHKHYTEGNINASIVKRKKLKGQILLTKWPRNSLAYHKIWVHSQLSPCD